MDLVRRLRAAGCVYAEDEARLLRAAAGSPAELATLVRCRVAGQPLEHLLGWVEFAGLRLTVAPGVFVPRRRTELLAAAAADAATAGGSGRGSVLVELCCGCGAVAAAVRAAVPGLRVHAVDIHPAAVRCARHNLSGAVVHQGDLFAPLPAALRGAVHVLVANAPYVPTAALPAMPAEAREHEPRLALDGGVDGLDVLRRVIGEAPGWLVPGGRVLVEAGERQSARHVELIERAGLVASTVCDAESGTVVAVGTAG
jgi:release factor glutamine methyltransferase